MSRAPDFRTDDYAADRSHLPRDVCEDLCTKTMYLAADDRELTEEDPEARSLTAAFWCRLTQLPFGPDDGIVEPESCRAGRPCATPRFHLEV